DRARAERERDGRDEGEGERARPSAKRRTGSHFLSRALPHCGQKASVAGYFSPQLPHGTICVPGGSSTVLLGPVGGGNSSSGARQEQRVPFVSSTSQRCGITLTEPPRLFFTRRGTTRSPRSGFHTAPPRSSMSIAIEGSERTGVAVVSPNFSLWLQAEASETA